MKRAFSLALIGVLAACHSAQPRTKPAWLKVVAEPETAVVYVDERFLGPARKLAEHPAPLKPGPRRVTVQAPSHFPHDILLELAAGVTTLEVQLRPIPP